MVEKIEVVPKEILTAHSLCEDLKSTSVGPHVRNIWTKYADQLLLTQPEMEKGLLLSNYQNWLDWSYEMLSSHNGDNPIRHRLRNLRELDTGIEILWAMSFEEKGFPELEKVNAGSIMFRSFYYSEEANYNSFFIERELVQDRFGENAIVERYYDSADSNDLLELTTITTRNPDESIFILKIDDTERWSYQQWYQTFAFNLDEGIIPLIDVKMPILSHLAETSFVKIYDEKHDNMDFIGPYVL